MECSLLPAATQQLCKNVSSGQDPFKANVSMTIFARISIPFIIVNLFGVYLILYHSRTFLKPLRTQLLILQVVSLSGDFSLLELLQPTAYFPLALGHMNGPLCTVLKIPPVYALMGCVFLTCSVPPAIFQVILYKHQLLQSPGSRMRVEPWIFKLFMICFYSITLVAHGSVFVIGDLSAGPFVLNQSYPFLSSYLFDPNAVMVYVNDNPLFPIWGIGILSGTIFEACFGVLIVISCWYTINTRLSSKTTRKYEMKLLIALLVQLMVPMLTFVAPITYSFMVFYHDWWFIQDFNNFALFFTTQHSFLSTLLMIYINRPYREATKAIILKFPPVNCLYTIFGGKKEAAKDLNVSRTTRAQEKIFRKSVPSMLKEGNYRREMK